MYKRIIKTVVVCAALINVFTGCGDTKESELISLKSADAAIDIPVSSGSAMQAQADKDTADKEQTAGAESSQKTEPRLFVVYVCGEVNEPGVYELYEGARVNDAVIKAGGLKADADVSHINLAMPLIDGQMVYILSVNETQEIRETGDMSGIPDTSVFIMDPYAASVTGPAAGSAEDSVSSGLININTASKEELMSLSGIGEAKADKIISYRESNGPFSSTSDIMLIPGIKDGLYGRIKDSICVD